MTLPPLTGHLAARRRLASARAAGKLPQVLLFTGAAGVGKQRLALWLAQLIQCEAPGEEPCGRCRSCRLTLGLAHPDVHWFVPIPRPKASDPEKQVEEASQALAELMEERRHQPLYPVSDGMAIHGIASARLLQRRAALTSVEGRGRIFIIGEADRLVPQEASQEAANALLKLLEEPPPGSWFVLTTVEARRLLPTIRSRSVTLRLGRVSDEELAEFLRTHLRPAPSPQQLERLISAADGSIGRALSAGAESGRAQQAAQQVLEAVAAGPGAARERALRQPPWSARGEFTAMLDEMAETLGDAVRATLGHESRRPIPRSLLRHRDARPLVQAMELVADAREAAWGNVNPQILLAVLTDDLAEVL